MSRCRALGLVPWGISVPSTCPRPDRLWDEGLEYRPLPVPDKTFPANQDSLAVPACSLCLRLLGTHWERWPYPRTLPHPPGRGDFCFSHQAIVYVPHPEGALATNSSKQGSAVCCPIGQRQPGPCPLPTEWWRGDRLGLLVPRKGRKVKVQSCSWTTQSSGSVSKEHHFFVF